MGGRSKAASWIAATVVVVLLILVAGWMLAVSPKHAEAADEREEAAQIEAQNAILAAEVAELREDFLRLDQIEDDVAALRAGIPAGAEYAALIREIDTAASASGVFLSDLSFGVPAVVDTTPEAAAQNDPTPAETAAEASEAAEQAGDVADGELAADSDEGDETDEAPTEPPATDTIVPLLEGFYSIPVTITVLGTYPSTTAFLAAVQTGLERLVLVTSFSAVSQEEAVATDGRPATVLGDVALSISGLTFVLVDPAAGPPVDESTRLPAATGRNPFLPVGGTTAGDEVASDDAAETEG